MSERAHPRPERVHPRTERAHLMFEKARGGSSIFIGEGLQVLGGALLATEGAPLPLTVTMHYNTNYEMLV